MQNSRALSDWIVEQTTTAIIHADRSETIQRWNAAAEVLFGHSAPEAIGGNLDLIIPERLGAAHWRG
ncbi:PAS domain-containing protein [Paraburkholderia hospita]|jgi:PAS domain S-box-containing protein|uniref:PAS domain-containing protein n=1 Tax=Paraburkholderia hospita TaxID=169430 RepID=UPI0008A7A0D4|nr:PAS domain-containing protein [Paraburkholderia hospita]SEI22770.1 PAS domain S-box-containing protein [Paraburkholderia hospita]